MSAALKTVIAELIGSLAGAAPEVMAEAILEEIASRKIPNRLYISFGYNHALGVYTAFLENGSAFTVQRSHVSDRLENALRLFAQGVVASEGGKWAKPIKIKEGDLGYAYSESQVRRFTRSGAPKLDLSDLDLDLGDIDV